MSGVHGASAALRRRPWARIARAAGLAGLLLCAGFVAHTTPDESVRDASFDVHGVLGETLVGRNLAATVTDASFVDAPRGEIWGEPWLGESEGTWLVLDAEAACVESLCLLQSATLGVDDTEWAASERPGSLSLNKTGLTAGIPTAGSLLFEVPSSLAREAAESTQPIAAELRLAISTDSRLDSLLVVTIDLAELEHRATTQIVAPGWARP